MIIKKKKFFFYYSLNFFNQKSVKCKITQDNNITQLLLGVSKTLKTNGSNNYNEKNLTMPKILWISDQIKKKKKSKTTIERRKKNRISFCSHLSSTYPFYFAVISLKKKKVKKNAYQEIVKRLSANLSEN